MKKIIALLLIVVLSMSITACKPQKDDFVGEWKRGVYAIIDELYYNTLTLNADGTSVEKVIMNGSDYAILTMEGTWVWDKDNMEIRITCNSATKILKYDKTAKTLTHDSTVEIIYRKVGS